MSSWNGFAPASSGRRMQLISLPSVSLLSETIWRIPIMRIPILAATAAAAMTLTGCANGGFGSGYGRGYDNGGYVLRDNDQIYRDARGNYYCQKPDGTTGLIVGGRSDEHTSELQSLMRISYAVFGLQKKN